MDIPYKSHIRNLLRSLRIIDVETLIDLNKCTLITLLHRDELSKEILVKNIHDKKEEWWLHKDIKRISEYFGIDSEKVLSRKLKENDFRKIL